jgi:quercetin dioxygenase-like cupin family protein
MGRTTVKLSALAALAILAAAPAAALAAEPALVTPILRTETTVTGQPIALPQGAVQVSAVTLEIPAGGKLPPHQHPYPRFAYVLSGRLSVTYVDQKLTKVLGPGDFLVEAVGQTHFGETLGPEPVRLLVIDQAPPGHVNTIPARQEPR